MVSIFFSYILSWNLRPLPFLFLSESRHMVAFPVKHGKPGNQPQCISTHLIRCIPPDTPQEVPNVRWFENQELGKKDGADEESLGRQETANRTQRRKRCRKSAVRVFSNGHKITHITRPVGDEKLPWSGRRQQKKRGEWRKKRQRYAKTTQRPCNVFILNQDGGSQSCKIEAQSWKNKENQSLVLASTSYLARNVV